MGKNAVDPVLAEVARLKKKHGEDYDTASLALAAWFQNNKATPSFGIGDFATSINMELTRKTTLPLQEAAGSI